MPTYSLSSVISRSWIFVPRPSTMMSRPVASGSSVPQWPTFLKSSRRRTMRHHVVRGHAPGFVDEQDAVYFSLSIMEGCSWYNGDRD